MRTVARRRGPMLAASMSGLPGSFACCLLAMLAASPVAAMVPIQEEVASALDRSPAQGALRLEAFPLDDGTMVALELERFEVWAPGAVVVERGEDGERVLAPPTTSYFRGRVVGDPESWAFLAKDETLRGFVATGGRLYAVAPAGDAYRDPRAGTESLVRQIDGELDSPLDRPLFRCDNEGRDLLPPDGPLVAVTHQGLLAHAMSNGKTYQVTVAIDTDYELYQHFGSTGALASYVSDLVAASSAIYNRDLQTVLRLGNVYTYSTAADPWSATDTVGALDELGDYWHANRPKASVPRTTVHFLSYKDMGGGVSWVGVLCTDDFYQSSHWGGGYGVSASLNGQFSTTSPSLYWDILCFTHELGHNFSSPHTHCYMNIPNAGAPPVDQCWNTQSGTNCWTGALCGTSGQPSCSGGTIMSYCHLRSGGYNNIVLYFGFSGQQSERVQNYMRSYIETRAATYPSCMPELLPLSVGKNGTGSGSVSSNPAGIDCGSTCSALFVKNGSVTLTATAAGGSTFAGWSGAGCSGTGTCQVTMDAAKSVTATFNTVASFALSLSKDGTGSGTVTSSPTGVDCGSDCSETYSEGTLVTLTAAADTASAFAGWSGGGCSGTSTCQVTMNAAKSVTATFTDVTACTTTVTDQAFTGTQLYESCHGIYAGPNVSVTTSSGHLTLRAASLVVLRNGFSVGSSGRLTVALDPSLAGT